MQVQKQVRRTIHSEHGTLHCMHCMPLHYCLRVHCTALHSKAARLHYITTQCDQYLTSTLQHLADLQHARCTENRNHIKLKAHRMPSNRKHSTLDSCPRLTMQLRVCCRHVTPKIYWQDKTACACIWAGCATWGAVLFMDPVPGSWSA